MEERISQFVIHGKVSLLKMEKRNVKDTSVVHFRPKMNKKGALLNQVLIQILLVILVFAAFLMVTADKVNSRGVRQQVVESELALLIDSAVPGMSFGVWKTNMNGLINNVELKDSRIYVSLEGLGALKGRAYFSRHDVSVEEKDDKFVVLVK